ncbi:MAG: hypothetical protein M0R38_03025 [Bacteroidia bacterium]|nr:hypothetical protein [Bacteroidia bacterium]
MNKLSLKILMFLVCSLSGTYATNAQNEIEIITVQKKKRKINFTLINKSVIPFEIENIPASFKKGVYTPFYYSFISDTLQIKLIKSDKFIQTGHPLTDSIRIEGETANRKTIVYPDEKLLLSIPYDKSHKTRVIELILSETQVLYHTID